MLIRIVYKHIHQRNGSVEMVVNEREQEEEKEGVQQQLSLKTCLHCSDIRLFLVDFIELPPDISKRLVGLDDNAIADMSNSP